MLNVDIIVNGTTYKVDEILMSASWSGSVTQVARKMEIEILSEISVPYGSQVNVKYEGKNIFKGVVFSYSENKKKKTLKITAYDRLIYLLKNQAYYNWAKKTPEAIMKQVCTDFGLPVGHVETGGTTLDYICDGSNLYDALMKVYTIAARKNGKKYTLQMVNDKVSMILSGQHTNIPIYSTGHLEDVNFNGSIENMVNKVLVIDEKGKKVGNAANNDWTKKYGTLQKVVKQSSEEKVSASSHLEGADEKLSVTTFGNPSLISCWKTYLGVRKEDGSVDPISGDYFIEQDTHTFKNNVYQCKLVLRKNTIMDYKD